MNELADESFLQRVPEYELHELGPWHVRDLYALSEELDFTDWPDEDGDFHPVLAAADPLAPGLFIYFERGQYLRVHPDLPSAGARCAFAGAAAFDGRPPFDTLADWLREHGGLAAIVATGLANGAQMALQWDAECETVRFDGSQWECVHQGSWLLHIQDFVFDGFTPYVQVNDLGHEVVGVPDGYMYA